MLKFATSSESMSQFTSVLMCFCLCSMIFWAYGAPNNTEAEDEQTPKSLLLTTVLPRETVMTLETCSLDVMVERDVMSVRLVKEPETVVGPDVNLPGQGIICKRGENEAAEEYMDQDVGAEALIISLVHEGILSTSIVLQFELNNRKYSLEPHWRMLSDCVVSERGLKPLSTFIVFGGAHFLYDVTDRHGVDVVTSSGALMTTTEEGPVDPPEPPTEIIVFVVCILLLIFFVVVFFCWYCRCRSTYKTL